MKPMLAMPIEITDLFNHKPFKLSPVYLAQPKINGIRATWHPEKCKLYTKNGREITSMPHIVYDLNHSNMKFLPLDGEISSDEVTFYDLNGLVRRGDTRLKKEKEHTIRKILEGKINSCSFYVFDFMDPDIKALKRDRLLQKLQESDNILRVPSFMVKNEDEAKDYYDVFLSEGFEGIIFRNINALYSPGPTLSKAMYKLKPTFDLEAKLVGFGPAQDGPCASTFKTLLLQLPSGVYFKCGNLTDVDRYRLWNDNPIGATVNIKYSGEWTNEGRPVFARFNTIRTDI